MAEIYIYRERIKKGWNTRELAKKSGLSRSAINRYENGQTSPTINQMEILANAMGIKISDLYEEI